MWTKIRKFMSCKTTRDLQIIDHYGPENRALIKQNTHVGLSWTGRQQYLVCGLCLNSVKPLNSGHLSC